MVHSGSPQASRDICLVAARIFGWEGKPQTEVNITNQVGVICDEATRARLIALRERITLAARAAKQLEASPPASVSSAPTTARP